MLTTLLTSIQSALTAAFKGFVVVALLPTLYFAGVSLLLLSAMDVGWADRAHLERFAKDGVPLSIAILGLCAAAFVLTAAQPALFRLLEGDDLPESLRVILQRRQTRRLDALRDDAVETLRTMTALAVHHQTRIQNVNAVAHQPSQAARDLIDGLWSRRAEGREIDAAELDAAVTAFCTPPAAGTAAVPLDELADRLRRLIAYSHDRNRYHHYRTKNEMQFRFPGDAFDPTASSDNILAPTEFGNIGRTMRSYALRRYSIDLDIFWSRFQKAMADSSNKAMFETLQAQKTFVDFAVTMFWLTVLLAVIWIPWLGVQRLHPRLFQAVALGGPLAVWAFYRAACQAYLLFADSVRTAVDFFRFDVLRGLRITEPAGTGEEEVIWARLGSRIGYANQSATFLYGKQP